MDPYLFRMTFSKVVVHEGDKVLRPTRSSSHATSSKKPMRHHERFGRQLSKTNPNARSTPVTPAVYRVKQQPFAIASSVGMTGPPKPVEHEGDMIDSVEDYEVSEEESERSEDTEEEEVLLEEEGKETEEGGEAKKPQKDYTTTEKEVGLKVKEEKNESTPQMQTAIPHPEKQEGERPIKGYRYLVEVAVGRGRAPVYFNCHGRAFFRLSGSIHMMQESMIEERKLLGRPPLAATPGVAHIGTLSPSPYAISLSKSSESLISPRAALGGTLLSLSSLLPPPTPLPFKMFTFMFYQDLLPGISLADKRKSSK